MTGDYPKIISSPVLSYHIFLEASKKILEYLAAISTSSDDVERIKDRLLESNPVLEVSTRWVRQCIFSGIRVWFFEELK